MVFFIESDEAQWVRSDKVGKMFMNISTIGEEASNEILKIFELSFEQSYDDYEEDEIKR